MDFKFHIKLDFDIKTNDENMENILSLITETVKEKLGTCVKERTEIEVMPTITVINEDQDNAPDKTSCTAGIKHVDANFLDEIALRELAAPPGFIRIYDIMFRQDEVCGKTEEKIWAMVREKQRQIFGNEVIIGAGVPPAMLGYTGGDRQ